MIERCFKDARVLASLWVLLIIGPAVAKLRAQGVSSSEQETSEEKQAEKRAATANYKTCPESMQYPEARTYGVVRHDGRSATVLARGEQPLERALNALSNEYGWTIDYADPPYSGAYAVCNFNPTMLAVLAFPFQSEFLEPRKRTSNDEERRVLEKVVSDYNQTPNPGKFEVRDEGNSRFAVVGKYVRNEKGGDEPIRNLVDLRVSLPTQRQRVWRTLRLLLDRLVNDSGLRVQTSCGYGCSPPGGSNSYSTLGGQDVVAMKFLSQLAGSDRWQMFWEPRDEYFPYHLNFLPAVASPGPVLARKTQLLTYRNQKYRISFQYPATYHLDKGPSTIQTYIPFPCAPHDSGAKVLATVELPEDAYPYSDLGQACFSVSVHRHLARDQCRNVNLVEERSSGPVIRNGVLFDWSEGGGAALGHGQGDDEYVLVRNGTCYEFTLGSTVTNAAIGAGYDSDDPNATVVLPVDRDDVLRRLGQIFSTVRLDAVSLRAKPNEPSVRFFQVVPPVNGNNYKLSWEVVGLKQSRLSILYACADGLSAYQITDIGDIGPLFPCGTAVPVSGPWGSLELAVKSSRQTPISERFTILVPGLKPATLDITIAPLHAKLRRQTGALLPLSADRE